MTQDADGADFLYPAENFIAYAGKHLREKRNHLYQFRREYPDAVFEPIGDANIHEVMTFFEAYRAENGSDEALAATENDICREVLENRGSYGFLSLALRIDGGIRAFIPPVCPSREIYGGDPIIGTTAAAVSLR